MIPLRKGSLFKASCLTCSLLQLKILERLEICISTPYLNNYPVFAEFIAVKMIVLNGRIAWRRIANR